MSWVKKSLCCLKLEGEDMERCSYLLWPLNSIPHLPHQSLLKASEQDLPFVVSQHLYLCLPIEGETFIFELTRSIDFKVLRLLCFGLELTLLLLDSFSGIMSWCLEKASDSRHCCLCSWRLTFGFRQQFQSIWRVVPSSTDTFLLSLHKWYHFSLEGSCEFFTSVGTCSIPWDIENV